MGWALAYFPAKSRLDSGVLESGVFNNKTSAVAGERDGGEGEIRERESEYGSEGERPVGEREREGEGKNKMRVF
jgi:hypothetical protein